MSSYESLEFRKAERRVWRQWVASCKRRLRKCRRKWRCSMRSGRDRMAAMTDDREKTTPPEPKAAPDAGAPEASPSDDKSAPPPAMTPDALSLALASDPRFVAIKSTGKGFIPPRRK